MPPPLPPQLISDIDAGQCVAFVGAGFSAPVVDSWQSLLLHLATGLNCEPAIESLVALGRSRDLEAAAQTILDEAGRDVFSERLRDLLADPDLGDGMKARVKWLTEIPLRAILTTNFDGVLPGVLPGREAFLQVLRRPDDRWWSDRFWSGSSGGPPVVKLHGDVNVPDPVVFTQRDYRRRLYSNPAYMTFLRSVFATQTVLYLGFSFTDAYLNELRSEVLALVEHESGDRPLAYAVVGDATLEEADYLHRHEGIEVLPFDTSDGTDFSGFDGYLEALHAASNPITRLGSLVAGKKILWVDPADRNNEAGMRFLRRSAAAAGGSTEIVTASNPATALEKMRQQPMDLVISHWGHGIGTGGSAAIDLLDGMHREGLRSPVVIFASSQHANTNKQTAMKAGAAGFQYSWEGLFAELERILGPAN